MSGHTRWEDIKKLLPEPSPELRAKIAFDHALGQEHEFAERTGTTSEVISDLEVGGGVENRIDTLTRIAQALNRHLVLSFPENLPDNLPDSVRVI